MCNIGDLARLPDELSELFLKALTHLSLQIPIICTILGLINTTKNYNSFVMDVVEKLTTTLEDSLNELNIPKCKLILRSLACLASCDTITLESSGSNGGFIALLDNMMDAMEQNNNDGSLTMSLHNTIVFYLVASTLPWCIDALKYRGGQQGQNLCVKLLSMCQAFGGSYVSDYSVQGKHAVFYVLAI